MSIKPWRMLLNAALVTATVLLVAACSDTVVTVTATNTPAPPTATPVPSCATLDPGAVAVSPIPGFHDVGFPSGSVINTPTVTGGGVGQFTVSTYLVCFTGTTAQVNGPFHDHNSMTATLLGEGWSFNAPFPYDGQYLDTCASPASCLSGSPSDPVQPDRYVALDQITDHGNSLITFRMRLAAPPTAPHCSSNFSSSPIQGYQATGLQGLPLPPLSLVAPDDASGGQKGEDVCSAGTVTSISAFLTTELPAHGWTHNNGSNSACIITAQCWNKGSNYVSFNVGTDPTSWIIAYRAPFP